MKILVVGGAGYIGSHCVRQLILSGFDPVVLDNLVFGHRAAIPDSVPFYREDLGDRKAIEYILQQEEIDIVMHFAAFAYVGESVKEPLKYYSNNLGQTIQLLQAMTSCKVGKFVFSSTCATYGIPETVPIKEDFPQRPINPYGQSKLDVENLLRACASAYGLSSASFRYFNAAGAADDGSIGEDHDPETHLIPLAIEAAQGNRDKLVVFGNDYDTPDGTCLRDYIHVDDLSRAHIAVFDKLKQSGQCLFYNLGTGVPASVMEIIATVEKVSGLTVPYKIGPRRPGDPPALYADSSKARQELGWQPKYQELNDIISTAWNWHKSRPDGFAENWDS